MPTLGLNKNQKLQFQADMQNYHRKIKLATYFRNAPKKIARPFVGPSIWSPPDEKLSPDVKRLIKTDLDSFDAHFKLIKEKCNLSLSEQHALKELKRVKHIVIKPADKGSAVVILDRDQYIFEVERQLNDTMYYKKLTKPIYLDTIPLVEEILKQLKSKKFINGKQARYLRGDFEPRERRFYILPKIHKSPEKWTIPFQLPPGRPIVSDCGSETYRTAEYLDFHLNPLASKHPSYVKDTYHFIEMVKNLTVPSQSYFFSMDVNSLYTNIDIQAGLASVRKTFDKYPDPKRPDKELLQLLEINLMRNDFMFNGQYYLQIKGTAMGKKFAPAYANIFMANWEESVFAKCEHKPSHYFRYLDDIWGIWEGSKEQFQEFVDVLNSHDPSIKLEAEIHEQTIDFLDTTVYKGPTFETDNKLDIKVFFKKTDTHALLYKSSFHPKHTFKGIVKSQILRFKRICTQQTDFREAVQILFKALRGRGYCRTFLRHCLKQFHRTRERDQGDLIPLISTYGSVNVILNGKFKHNFDDIIGKTDLLPDTRVISAYRRNPNLCDLLVRAKLPSLAVKKPLILEKQFSRLRFVKNHRDNTVIQLQQSFSTKSKNCIYLLYCLKCNRQYVGETKNTLSTRMVQHRYNVRHRKEVDTPLVKHILLHGMDSIRMAGLQKNVSWTDRERKNMERFWIYQLGTMEPDGLNLKRN